LTTSI